jgi:branched-chain amino acid transport system ATP-binding protein
MLAIGRALVINPSLLLLDEPSEGLSPVAVDRVIDVDPAPAGETGIAVLLVEQNIRVADAVADRVYVMLAGRSSMRRAGAAFARDTATHARSTSASRRFHDQDRRHRRHARHQGRRLRSSCVTRSRTAAATRW